MFRLHVRVTAYRRQTLRDRGVVRSCDPLKNSRAPIISLERLNLKTSNLAHRYAVSILATWWYITHKKGRGHDHVTVLKFCRLPWYRASRVFVSDSWATCYGLWADISAELPLVCPEERNVNQWFVICVCHLRRINLIDWLKPSYHKEIVHQRQQKQKEPLREIILLSKLSSLTTTEPAKGHAEKNFYLVRTR